MQWRSVERTTNINTVSIQPTERTYKPTQRLTVVVRTINMKTVSPAYMPATNGSQQAWWVVGRVATTQAIDDRGATNFTGASLGAWYTHNTTTKKCHIHTNQITNFTGASLGNHNHQDLRITIYTPTKQRFSQGQVFKYTTTKIQEVLYTHQPNKHFHRGKFQVHN